MPKQHLAENFVDDILSENMNGRRRYNLIQNSDGTVSLEDVTEYTQLGSDYGANQVNASNRAINESVDKANVIDNKEDLLANMTEGKVAGALATKKGFDELNSKLEFNLEDHWGGVDFSGTVKATVIGHNVMISVILQTAREIEAGRSIKARVIPSKYINIAPSELLIFKSFSEIGNAISLEMMKDGTLTIYPYVTLRKGYNIYETLNYII